MASVVTSLLSGGIQGAGQGIAAVINAIKGKSPEDAAKLAQIQGDLAQLQIKYQEDFALAKINENVQLNQVASENIVAESKAGWLQSLARPSVIWMGNIVMIWNFVVRPMFIRWQLQPISLPDMFWWTWGTVVTGYVFTRTAQDVMGKTVGGAGGTVSLPFGIKVDSKGD